jgi:hypothetical protein
VERYEEPKLEEWRDGVRGGEPKDGVEEERWSSWRRTEGWSRRGEMEFVEENRRME